MAAGSESPLVLEAGTASARFEPDHGGRLASLRFGGNELLVEPEGDALRWGSYPMAPWAGRIRHGRFAFGGLDHQLPINHPPHAIHGTAFGTPWRLEADPLASDPTERVMVLDLGDPWPYPARLEQRASLHPDHLTVELRLVPCDEPMPAMLGWHPWFRRTIGGVDAELTFEAGAMVALDDELIPTGELVPVPPGPWDNPFLDVRSPPVIRWPGIGSLSLTSSCPCWVIYTEPAHALCVEPQTAVPDVVNRPPGHRLDASGPPPIATPDQALTATMTLSWTADPSAGTSP